MIIIYLYLEKCWGLHLFPSTILWWAWSSFWDGSLPWVGPGDSITLPDIAPIWMWSGFIDIATPHFYYGHRHHTGYYR
jgi:hypothetical protein